MNRNAKKTKGKTKTIKEIVKESPTLEAAQEAASEVYKTQPVYQIFQFFFGSDGPIHAPNDQKGKPGGPPPY